MEIKLKIWGKYQGDQRYEGNIEETKLKMGEISRRLNERYGEISRRPKKWRRYQEDQRYMYGGNINDTKDMGKISRRPKIWGKYQRDH